MQPQLDLLYLPLTIHKHGALAKKESMKSKKTKRNLPQCNFIYGKSHKNYHGVEHGPLQ
jgi:hypothetical protein